MVAAKEPRPLDIPEDVWSEAVRREGVVRSLVVAGINGRAAVRAAASALGLSPAQVYRLIATFRENPVAGSLVVMRLWAEEGRPPAAVRRRATDRAGHQRHLHDPRAANDGQAAARSAQGLHGRGSEAAVAHGNPGSRVGALAQGDGEGAREGSAAARQRFVPVRPAPASAGHRSMSFRSTTPRWTSNSLTAPWLRAVLGRPWLTLLLDVFSRSVLGFYLSLDAPSAVGVAMAIAQGILPKSEWLMRNNLDLTWPTHGLPRSLHLDNGAEFHSRALKRGCQQHGVRIDYRPPATPRFGGHIERLMGTLSNIGKTPGAAGFRACADAVGSDSSYV